MDSHGVAYSGVFFAIDVHLLLPVVRSQCRSSSQESTATIIAVCWKLAELFRQWSAAI
jgi:hypothetical protein